MSNDLRVQVIMDLLGRDGKEFDTTTNKKKDRDVLKLSNLPSTGYPHTKKVELTVGKEKVIFDAEQLRAALERVLGDSPAPIKISYPYSPYISPWYTTTSGTTIGASGDTGFRLTGGITGTQLPDGSSGVVGYGTGPSTGIMGLGSNNTISISGSTPEQLHGMKNTGTLEVDVVDARS